MKFKDWLLFDESTGRTNSRPTQQFAANRGQLWGPSAQFGQPDSMLPGEKAIGGIVTGIGSSIAKRMRRDISPQPSILGLRMEKEPLIQTMVLPLQYSEDINMSANSYQKPRTLLYKVMSVFDIKKINFSGKPEEDKYLLPDLSIDDQTNMAVNFTKGLIFNYLRLKFKNQNKKYILDDPEVLLEDRKDMGEVSYLRVAVSYKRREIPKELDDKLSGQPAYQGRENEDDVIDRLKDVIGTRIPPLPPGSTGTSEIKN